MTLHTAVVPQVLTDQSVVFDVVLTSEAGNTVRFPCYDEEAARRLKWSLDDDLSSDPVVEV